MTIAYDFHLRYVFALFARDGMNLTASFHPSCGDVTHSFQKRISLVNNPHNV